MNILNLIVTVAIYAVSFCVMVFSAKRIGVLEMRRTLLKECTDGLKKVIEDKLKIMKLPESNTEERIDKLVEIARLKGKTETFEMIGDYIIKLK